VADNISGFKTLEQSSGSQRPKFRQELSKFEEVVGPTLTTECGVANIHRGPQKTCHFFTILNEMYR